MRAAASRHSGSSVRARRADIRARSWSDMAKAAWPTATQALGSPGSSIVAVSYARLASPGRFSLIRHSPVIVYSQKDF